MATGYSDTFNSKLYSTGSSSKSGKKKTSGGGRKAPTQAEIRAELLRGMQGQLASQGNSVGSPFSIPNPYANSGDAAAQGRFATTGNPLAATSVTDKNNQFLMQAYQEGVGNGTGVSPNDPNLTRNDGGTGGGGAVGSDPWGGFASQYAPGGADILYDDPRILVRDQLKKMGFNPDSGLMDLLGEQAGDLQYLMMLGPGSGTDSLNTQTDESYVNFGADWAKNMATPGGSVMDVSDMVASILDAPGGSALKAALAGGTPQEQAATLNQLLQVATGGLTPLMQRAMGRMMQDKTDDWLSSQAKGQDSSLSDWLQRGGKGLFG